ncbi:MAG: MarR family transcriptional regulator [Clostridia bacterium]|nr:MarR family transcriptional regulator [Clostridia bacterium]
MEKKDLIIELVEHVDILGRAISSYREAPRSYGVDEEKLTEIEVRVLRAIGNNKGITNQKLVNYLQRTKSAVSMMVEKLVKRGYIEKNKSKSDARKYELNLTGKGYAVYHIHSKIINEYYFWLSKQLYNYSESDFKKSIEIVKDIINYWNE